MASPVQELEEVENVNQVILLPEGQEITSQTEIVFESEDETSQEIPLQKDLGINLDDLVQNEIECSDLLESDSINNEKGKRPQKKLTAKEKEFAVKTNPLVVFLKEVWIYQLVILNLSNVIAAMKKIVTEDELKQLNLWIEVMKVFLIWKRDAKILGPCTFLQFEKWASVNAYYTISGENPEIWTTSFFQKLSNTLNTLQEQLLLSRSITTTGTLYTPATTVEASAAVSSCKNYEASEKTAQTYSISSRKRKISEAAIDLEEEWFSEQMPIPKKTKSSTDMTLSNHQTWRTLLTNIVEKDTSSPRSGGCTGGICSDIAIFSPEGRKIINIIFFINNFFLFLQDL